MRTLRFSIGVFLLVALLAAVAFTTVGDGANESEVASGGTAPASQPWDLVYISDSSGWGVARLYAGQIRQARGVRVRVHDEWQSGLAAVTILQALRTSGHPWVRMVRNAEVIVVYGNPAGLGIKDFERGGCHCLATFGCRAPLAVTPRTWRPYVATLKTIYKRIFELRKGKPVILRTANWYVPMILHAPNSPFYAPMSWERAGIVEVCTRWQEEWQAAIARAAAAYRVRLADVYRAFNGPGHREDPFAKGYLQADGIHPSNAGRAVIAQRLAGLGYAKVRPPR